ncbi:MAG: outer membrane protein assembly factor BamE [Alphaproteobacteria bacterium]|nr:outer membrane protein assembly factor BamE [Alphaproteobacteria bacterium]
MNLNSIALLSLTACLLTACKSASEHRREVTTGEGPSTFTLGKVQSSVQKGMGQDQVIAAIGSPNIVTNDDRGHETWVYDKIATEGAYSKSVGGFIFWEDRAGAYENTQKTLTVMIKFDRQKRVHDINYHQSKF